MTINWPFGNFRANNFVSQFQSGFLGITPDAGIPYRRQTFTDIAELVQCTWILKDSDNEYFKDFYRRETKQGTLPFYIYDCRHNITRLARFYGDEAPQHSYIGAWQITFKLYLEPVTVYYNYPIISQDGYMLLTETGYPILSTVQRQV